MHKRTVAGLAAFAMSLGLAFGVTSSAAADPVKPIAKPGMLVVEVPAYPGQRNATKSYIEVPAADRQAAENARPEPARDKAMPPAPKPAQVISGPVSGKRVVCAPDCRHYGRIIEDTDISDLAYGLSATITIGKPYTNSVTEHSLGEVAVQSTDQQDIVEVMWRVNTGVRADGNPVLEAYHWIDGVGQGYRVGFVDYGPNPINLGAGLPKPVNKEFVVSSTSTDWWVGYDGAWVAYLPKSRFGVDEFGLASDQVKIGQVFYEVAAQEEHPCTDMGTGWDSNPFVSGTGSLFNYAWIGSATAVSVTGGIVTGPGGITGNADAYHFATTSATSGRGSGPGWDAAGVGAGTKGAC